jgi:hypothetical protein
MVGVRVDMVVLALLLAGQAGAHPPGVRDEDQAVAHEVEALREELKRAIERKDAWLSVYVKTGGRWQLAAGQATRLP